MQSNRLPQQDADSFGMSDEGSSAFFRKGVLMLCLSRETSEEIEITAPDGTKINLTILEVRNGKVRIGIAAPRDYIIWRREIAEAIQATATHT